LGTEEIELVRKELGWNYKPFEVPKNILKIWRDIGGKGEKIENRWNKIYRKKKSKINNFFKNDFLKSAVNEKKIALKEKKSLASRKSSESIICSLVKNNNTLIGGSADLAGSNNTKTNNHKIIKPGNFNGNYIHYGVREHAMCGIMNGLALHSKFIPYGGTFLIFSDYCKPSIRLAAMMKQQVIYVMTHDSIGLGEDGPTHQPIEQLSGLRSIPNLNVFRPADRLETIECWEHALKSAKTPSILSLTRQNLDPIRDKYSNMNKCSLGAYEVLRTNKKIKLTILASGSEVNLAIKASHK
jgi:Transketolase